MVEVRQHHLLDSTVRFSSMSDKNACKIILEALSDEELRLVAQASFIPQHYQQHHKKSATTTTMTTMTLRIATREALRHYKGAKHDINKAISNLRRTCAFRETYRIDILRSCMDDLEEKDPSNHTLSNHYRSLVQNHLRNHCMVVFPGSSHRAVLYVGRIESEVVMEEGFLLAMLYMMERACAATEARGQEQIEVVVEGSHQNHAPSRDTLIQFVNILQEHYRLRLKHLVVLNPSFWVRTLFIVMTPFLGQRTRQKITHVSGEGQKQKLGCHRELTPMEGLVFCTNQPFAAVYEDTDDLWYCATPKS